MQIGQADLVDERLAAIELACETTTARVAALECQVFNRTFPNARHAERGPRAPPRIFNHVRQLNGRLAALERAAWPSRLAASSQRQRQRRRGDGLLHGGSRVVVAQCHAFPVHTAAR
mmetsp:Transcript_41701/g.131049  ORF Transcript_41701/g.131049 Transcript_41701/m.131049 type:complete len:117 (+) Transcript_41701:390-740(+)